MNTSKNDDKRLAKIQKELKEIKICLSKSEKSSQRESIYGTGFAAMIASLAVLPYTVWGALALFVTGYVLLMISTFTHGAKKESSILKYFHIK